MSIKPKIVDLYIEWAGQCATVSVPLPPRYDIPEDELAQKIALDLLLSGQLRPVFTPVEKAPLLPGRLSHRSSPAPSSSGRATPSPSPFSDRSS